MKRQELEKKVMGIFAEQLGVSDEEIKPTSSLIEELGADSLDMVELLMAMEEEFEVEIPDEEADMHKQVEARERRLAEGSRCGVLAGNGM